MSPTDDLIPILKKLRMGGVMQSLEIRLRQAGDDNLAHVEFLYRVMHDEVERREAKQLSLRLKRATFEHRKTIEDFDFVFNPKVPKSKLLDLATCSFVDRRENVLLLGQTGVGKSHLAQALGHRACMAGHAVLYTSAHRMLAALTASRADNSVERKLLRFTKPDLLIIDDLGLRALRNDEAMDLYEIISHRYERGAIVMTSNRASDELAQLFGDPLLASAAMDRLLHHSHVIEIEGDSYRNPPRPRRRGKETDVTA